jgi:fluoride exporter
MFMKIVWISVGGALGALSRYGLSGFVQNKLKIESFPWGTFSVNVVGCFFFGVVWMFAERHIQVSPTIRTALLIGFAGSFTTFSTLIFESTELLRTSQYLALTGNLIGQVIIGSIALVIGISIGKLL